MRFTRYISSACVLLLMSTGLFGQSSKLAPDVVALLYTLIPAVVQVVPVSSLLDLANNSSVKYVSLDRPIGGTLAHATDYSHVAVGATIAAGYGLTGSGVGVAILDSGISNHPDLASRVVYRQSFVASKNLDDYGHGTHVAGIVAGNGASSNSGVTGIAPGVKLVDLR